MSIVVDFAWTKPTVDQLKSWKAVAVGGYVSHDNTKNLNHNLIAAYAAAGIKTFLFFEDSADRAASGYWAGRSDAQFALALAESYGIPDWAPIIVSVDFDAPDYAPTSNNSVAKLGPIAQYLQAWIDVMGLNRIGVYGGFYVCQRAISGELAKYAIQTIAWSGGQVDLSQITLLQTGQMLDGGNVDVETIESSVLLDKIAWVPEEANPASPPVIKPEPPPGPWLNAKAWDWKQVAITGLGLDGKIYTFLYNHETGTWEKVSKLPAF